MTNTYWESYSNDHYLMDEQTDDHYFLGELIE